MRHIGLLLVLSLGACVTEEPTAARLEFIERVQWSPRECTTAADCEEGESCVGPIGCDEPWTCELIDAPVCRAKLAPFCTCDGETIVVSEDCLPTKVAHLGQCPQPVKGIR